MNGAGNCPNDCSGNGLCEDGACFCRPGFTGDSCSSSVDSLTSQHTSVLSKADTSESMVPLFATEAASSQRVSTFTVVFIALLTFVGGVFMSLVIRFVRTRTKDRSRPTASSQWLPSVTSISGETNYTPFTN